MYAFHTNRNTHTLPLSTIRAFPVRSSDPFTEYIKSIKMCFQRGHSGKMLCMAAHCFNYQFWGGKTPPVPIADLLLAN